MLLFENLKSKNNNLFLNNIKTLITIFLSPQKSLHLSFMKYYVHNKKLVNNDVNVQISTYSKENASLLI